MTAPVLAVTGGVAAGKSTFCQLLADCGARMLDADTVAHEVLDEADIREQVRDAFGAQVFDADGAVDRKRLADAAFADEVSLKRLTDIVYPAIRLRLLERLDSLARSGDAPIVLEAPTLFEAECDGLADLVVTVETSFETQCRRAAERGWDTNELERREARLIGSAERKQRADMTVENEGGIGQLKESAARLWAKLTA